MNDSKYNAVSATPIIIGVVGSQQVHRHCSRRLYERPSLVRDESSIKIHIIARMHF